MSITREHPSVILLKHPIVLFLLILPIAAALVPGWSSALPFKTAWQAHAAAVAVMTYVAVIRREERIFFCNDTMRIKRGIVTREEVHLPADAVTCVTVEKSPLYAIFGARKVTISDGSLGGIRSMVLPKKEGRRVCTMLTGECNAHFEERFTFCEGKNIVMSAISSNATSGILFFIPVWRGISRIIGENLSENIYEKLGRQWVRLMPLFDPIAAIVAGVVLLGWIINFIVTTAQNFKFCLFGADKCIVVCSGFLTKRRKCIKKDKISALEHKKTFFSMLFGLESVSAFVQGSRGKRGGKFNLVPAATSKYAQNAVNKVFGKHGYCAATIVPKRQHRRRYAAVPLTFLTVGLLLFIKSGAGKTLLSQLILFCLLITVWWLLVKISASRHAHFKVFCDSVSICGSVGFSICRQHILREKIEKVRISQTPFQRTAGLCTLYVRSKGAKRGITCAHISYEKAVAACRRL